MAIDLYNPSIKQSSWVDKMSDAILGTNKVDTINNSNRYEYQKAVNINKYSWNKQGMVQAGINPLVASGSLGQLGSSQAGSTQSGDVGMVGSMMLEIVDMLNPVHQLKEMKDTVKDLLHFIK